MAEILTSQVVSGLATGCVYALIALGFVLIFKATDVVTREWIGEVSAKGANGQALVDDAKALLRKYGG